METLVVRHAALLVTMDEARRKFRTGMLIGMG